MDAFTQGYIEAALWVFELDGLGVDLPPDLRAQAEEDCRDFQEANAETLGTVCAGRADWAQAGQDFYLTRERHGAGFWDGDWPYPAGRVLTEAAHAYGEWTEFTAWAIEEDI